MILSSEKRRVQLFIIIAFCFSVVVRLIWIYQFNNIDEFKYNNQFMINTNDGYFYAEGARDILADNDHTLNNLSPVNSACSIITAILVKILPFSFETIIFYMPIFFSSLLVIPIILIGQSLKKLEAGFIAALLGSIAWSYYNRTMAGYYDTDMLNIVFPTFLLWSLIWAIRTQEDKYIIFTAFEIISYRWWYPQSYSLEFAFFGLIAIYVLYQYIKKQDFRYYIILLTFMMFAMMGINGYIRFLLVICLFIVLKQNKELFSKYLNYIFIISIFLFMITGGLEPIWAQLKGYIFRDSIETVGKDLKLHFFSVMQTVREAGKIPFETFANRISGQYITFIASVIGYIWLVFRNKVMLLGIPMIGLGFLAYSGGLRFTVYAIPVLALGLGFLIVEVSSIIKNKILRYSLMGILTIIVLFPNIEHIINYKVPTVFTKDEVLVLDKLKDIANREDYVVSWWDYGYPIRYYSNVKTLIDGGQHSGGANFPVSYILSEPQNISAKMARLDVEYNEKAFKREKENKNLSNDKKIKIITNIAQMTLDYGFKNTNKFLESLKKDIKLPEKTRNIYLYLPNRMLNIYPTVTLFSNIDLMTGDKKKPQFFYKTTSFRENNYFIDLGNSIKLDKRRGAIIFKNQLVPINSFIRTLYGKNGKLTKQVQHINPSSNLYVIFMANYKQFLIVDDKVFNSTFFQLFVLENYNQNLFEPVILTPWSKVYKLKI